MIKFKTMELSQINLCSCIMYLYYNTILIMIFSIGSYIIYVANQPSMKQVIVIQIAYIINYYYNAKPSLGTRNFKSLEALNNIIYYNYCLTSRK